MARTQSATPRESFALPAVHAAATRQLSVVLHALAVVKGDFARSLAIVSGFALTLAGCFVPHADVHTLSALLFVAGASIALLALNSDASPAKSAHDKSPCSAPPVTAHRVRPLPRTLADLVLAQETGVDALHWHRLTQRMSHELRTPLNAVLGFSELMSSEVFGPLGSPQYQDYARSINCSGRILLKSAEDALAITNLLTRPSGRTRAPVASVRSGLDDMLAFHRPEALAAKIAIASDLENDCDIAGEPQTLRQILINLMAEAMQHAAPGSQIAIRSAACGDEVHVTFVLEGPRAHDAGGENSFALLLARTLLQLSDGRLEEETSACRWSAAASFPRAVQRDFFATA